MVPEEIQKLCYQGKVLGLEVEDEAIFDFRPAWVEQAGPGQFLEFYVKVQLKGSGFLPF